MEAERIDLTQPRYSQATFLGRLKHFIDVTNPKNLLASKQQILDSQKLVDDYQQGINTEIDVEKLWKAKKIVDSSIHPDTKEIIFLPFRMASFVPTNLIVTVGLLLPNPTTAGIIFWQWANQSCNVAINWANANKSVPMSLQETGFAYGCAVFASVSMALGLTALVKRSKFSPATASILNKCVPFASVATASSLNVMLMRGKEIVEGIHVYDKDGNIVGKSKVAGAHAIGQVAVSRVLTAFPALLLPPMILSVLEKKSFLKNNPRLFIPINAALVAASLLTALPAAIAVFPQRSPISIEKLESEFKTLTKERQLYFNKGL